MALALCIGVIPLQWLFYGILARRFQVTLMLKLACHGTCTCALSQASFVCYRRLRAIQVHKCEYEKLRQKALDWGHAQTIYGLRELVLVNSE